ncbi:MAG TPA: hypothetical protein VF665_18780 [Longimicrobium sp.]|jgi:hypothetical protein|uniref:hypothetical protein n=1 Tax=Longimicrobium sp. TaxID=2029185 RepID=UPI002ED8DE85
MWSILIVLSALAGVVCGWIIPGRRSVAWGAAVPWLGMLAWLLFNEYLVPSQGGGASMWPIAQLVAGTVAAAVGLLAAAVARAARAKLRASA